MLGADREAHPKLLASLYDDTKRAISLELRYYDDPQGRKRVDDLISLSQGSVALSDDVGRATGVDGANSESGEGRVTTTDRSSCRALARERER